ncbi:PHKG1 [Cordylochernes scorpioides]|uniref:PHKG1 n=1 Tax=Cordylochernes scorpioides TaxID=51811 RepID=A0ABY6JVL0_9ARAC|nr:PHKG1 [Cordylochernes scorpioides]
MNIANEMLDSVRNDPNLLQRVITGDEAWVYGYDVETKAQSSQWKLPHEPRSKKARQVRSNVKVLLTVFFDCRGVVHHEFLPQGRTVNKEYYLQVMRNLREAIRQKCPDLWKNKNWLLHHDNAPAHTSLLVRNFLAKNNTLMMLQPPYSPDLAPCDFFLFPKLKRPMKGRSYARLDKIKTASKEELKKIFKNDFFEVLRRLEKPLAQFSSIIQIVPYHIIKEGYGAYWRQWRGASCLVILSYIAEGMYWNEGQGWNFRTISGGTTPISRKTIHRKEALSRQEYCPQPHVWLRRNRGSCLKSMLLEMCWLQVGLRGDHVHFDEALFNPRGPGGVPRRGPRRRLTKLPERCSTPEVITWPRALLVGCPPFWHRKKNIMMRNIMEGRYEFTSPEWDDITEMPKDLIKHLLVVEPEFRFTATQALEHDFFKNVQTKGRTFNAKKTFQFGILCVRAMVRIKRLRFTPEPLSVDIAMIDPYRIKALRKVIDGCAFKVYGHWVKRGELQNRGALFENHLKMDTSP